MNALSETLRRALEAIDGICENPLIPVTPPPAAPTLNPSPWAEDFHRWTLAQCVYHCRCFGAIGALHCGFCEWLVAHDEIPCSRQTFERLLDGCGFLSADGMVSGLILREDLDALRVYPEIGRLLCSTEPNLGTITQRCDT
jgi:hypothetical protein